jgi:exopolyphosphatase/guanosine-5'-triphosphate,3'-diphosphate pyrophosphatase
MELTVAAIEAFVREAKAHDAGHVVVSATSAARDAVNGREFIELAQARAGVTVEILSGDEEARLSFASAHADFGGTQPLVVLDIGGGSTEFIFGDTTGHITYRHSFDVGSVRLTERVVKHDPPAPDELAAIEALLRETFAGLPELPKNALLVGVAGTATTVAAIARSVEPYDPRKVHGAQLTRAEIVETVTRLEQLPLALRRAVPGLQPKRADVVVAGAMILVAAVDRLQVPTCTVSDRGLRWGLLADRFGAVS